MAGLHGRSLDHGCFMRYSNFYMVWCVYPSMSSETQDSRAHVVVASTPDTGSGHGIPISATSVA